MRARAFNPQVFLESLCYFVFGGLLLYLVGSGKYLSYVTPRMAPYLYFTVAIMGIWAFVGLSRLFRPQYRVRAAHCFVLAIPILLLLLPHSPLNTSDLSGNYSGGNAFSGQSGQSSDNAPQKQTPPGSSGLGASAAIDLPSKEPAPTDVLATTAPEQTDSSDEENSTGLPGLDTVNKKITVSNDNFGVWYFEFYADMEKYKGYTVVMTGFVFKDSELLNTDEFVPARLMMSCCVADLSPVGLVCKYDKVSELDKDAWVTVEGTLFIGQYEYDGQKYDDPEIMVTKITPAEPVEGYVYPY
jgi:putative membrane protein